MQIIEFLLLNYQDISKNNTEILRNFCQVFELQTNENNLIQTVQNYVSEHKITNYFEANYHLYLQPLNGKPSIVSKKQARWLTIRNIKDYLEDKWRAENGLPSLSEERFSKNKIDAMMNKLVYLYKQEPLAE